MWKEALKQVEVEKGYNKGSLKRVEQLTKEYEVNILLYNNIRSQRNRFMRLVEVSILDMMQSLSLTLVLTKLTSNSLVQEVTMHDWDRNVALP